MPRQRRCAPGGYVYHAINRAVARLPLFQKEADYEAFMGVMEEALRQYPTRLLGFCVMPNHWHFVIWPERDGELTAFLRWLTHTHTQRWHAHHHTAGTGHLYQGRFKAFPIQEDEHLLTVLRYVERNPLRAKRVRRAEDWRWSSLGLRRAQPQRARQLLSAGPLRLPKRWVEWVNKAQTESEVAALRRSVARSSPFGEEDWQGATCAKLGLEWTLRPRGRPKKQPQ